MGAIAQGVNSINHRPAVAVSRADSLSSVKAADLIPHPLRWGPPTNRNKMRCRSNDHFFVWVFRNFFHPALLGVSPYCARQPGESRCSLIKLAARLHHAENAAESK
jgi:hypothetical protein